MNLNFFLAVEMVSKNFINRKFNLKPLSCLTQHLFYTQNTMLSLLKTIYADAQIVNTPYEVNVKAELHRSGYDFSFHFYTKKKLTSRLKKSNLLNFFMKKELVVSKDGVELYNNGHVSPEYSKHQQDIHNTIYFIGQELQNK